MVLTKHSWAPPIALAAITLLSMLHLAAVSPYWKISPDSATYIAGAESLAAGKGYQAGLRPPLTSWIYSLPARFFPSRYFAMNAVVTVFALLSAAACYLLFAPRTGTLRARLIVLLTLGSVFLFEQSTLLLSDIFYLFFATVPLVLMQRISWKKAPWWGALAVGVVTLLACLTRVVGLTLVVAILITLFAGRLKQRSMSASQWRLAGVMLGVAVCVLAWEYRNYESGLSSFELAFQVTPFVEESGYVSLLDLPRRFLNNLAEYRFLGVILTNHGFRDLGTPMFPGQIAAGLCLLLFGLGLLVRIKNTMTLLDCYCIVVLLVIGLYHPWIDMRWFLPLVPFLFFYAAEGVDWVAAKSSWLFGRLGPQLAQVGIIFYVVAYLGSGLVYMGNSVPQEWSSPFGTYPIKYTHNYGLQRLAMWLAERISDEENYLCLHPNVMAFLVKREGHALPLSRDPKALFAMLRDNDIRYVLADEKHQLVREYVLGALKTDPDRFQLMKRERGGSLYRVVLDSSLQLGSQR